MVGAGRDDQILRTELGVHGGAEPLGEHLSKTEQPGIGGVSVYLGAIERRPGGVQRRWRRWKERKRLAE